MLYKNTSQLDFLDEFICNSLIPKDHLLKKIKTQIDFSFIYHLVQGRYRHTGRASKDPVMMVKILLLEYFFKLSDVKVAEQVQCNMFFRWFLDLGTQEHAPDASTISYFRTQRLQGETYKHIFNKVLEICRDHEIITNRRYIIDSTHVEANASYPSKKKIIRQSFEKVLKEVRSADEKLAEQYGETVEKELAALYEVHEKASDVSAVRHCEITKKYLNQLKAEIPEDLKKSEKWICAVSLCEKIIEQRSDSSSQSSKDVILSVVDIDARVGRKTKKKTKKGYKEHIIIDEDSEIIVANIQTPFSESDGSCCIDLIEEAEQQMGVKPKEVSADAAYGKIENRAYLKDNGIIANIGFNKTSKENKVFGIHDFTIADDVSSITCPAGKTTWTYTEEEKSGSFAPQRRFTFASQDCKNCALRSQCINGRGKKRRLLVSSRYDAVLRDRKWAATEWGKAAYNQRPIVERRFAAMVRNHGLRQCPSVGLDKAKIHMFLAATACNLVRLMNILDQEYMA